MVGRLEVLGTLNLAQFWPLGGSDADTWSVKLEVGRSAFRFRANEKAKFEAVDKRFDGAVVEGRIRRPVVSEGQVIVRLQAIDAPELHYTPAAFLRPEVRSPTQDKLYANWSLKYRQPLAESSTLAVVKLLRPHANGGHIKCTVRSLGEQPSDFFDAYGRLIGEIWIHNQPTSVNHWILRSGWALPTFYDSMSLQQLTVANEAANEAHRANRGIWPWYTDVCNSFRFDLLYRGRGVEAKDDHGHFALPKLYRRLATYKVNAKCQMFSGTFRQYLEHESDVCYETSSYLQQLGAAKKFQLLDCIAANKLTVRPQDLVFKEPACTVFDRDGKRLEW